MHTFGLLGDVKQMSTYWRVTPCAETTYNIIMNMIIYYSVYIYIILYLQLCHNSIDCITAVK